jgi:hypothetical protein
MVPLPMRILLCCAAASRRNNPLEEIPSHDLIPRFETGLRQRGYAHVRYVSGGMSEWARRGWPMVKPAS